MDPSSLAGAGLLIDATHIFSSTTPTWPDLTRLLRCPTGDDQFTAEAYVFSGGYGTHTDSPLHFHKGKRSISDLDVTELVSPLVLIDVEESVITNDDYALTVEDIHAWEAKHGTIPKGALVVMRTGWSSRWPNEEKFRNVGADGKMHFPGFSPASATFLTTERDIHGIGIDTLSLDIGPDDDFPVHGINLGANKYQVENLNLSDKRIPAAGAHIIISPMKLEGAPEAPTRVFVVVPK